MHHSPTGAEAASSPGDVELASSPSDAESATHPAVKRVRKLSRLLDEAVTVPGTDYKIGLDPILGILPVVGDSVSTVFSLYILAEAVRLGVDTRTLARMGVYVAVDAVVGSVPVLGTLFDAVWKANAWNANLLEAHVEDEASATR